jgi:CheY-like chemotaxis protein
LQSTVIMMLTSGDGPDDIARCKSLGGAAHLIKPVKQSDLFDAIVAASGIAERVEEKSEPETKPSGMQPLRILLAEDSYANQRLAVGLLSKWGHDVTVANNGREAVTKLEEGDFDLILMDVQMPEMDGYQATAVIRERELRTANHIPIIAMTAHAMKGDREECLAAGMDEYVSKPIRLADLRSAIEKTSLAKLVERQPDEQEDTG